MKNERRSDCWGRGMCDLVGIRTSTRPPELRWTINIRLNTNKPQKEQKNHRDEITFHTNSKHSIWLNTLNMHQCSHTFVLYLNSHYFYVFSVQKTQWGHMESWMFCWWAVEIPDTSWRPSLDWETQTRYMWVIHHWPQSLLHMALTAFIYDITTS